MEGTENAFKVWFDAELVVQYFENGFETEKLVEIEVDLKTHC